MVLPYFDALLDLNLTPNTDWKDDFQQYIDYEFENSSSIYDIEEELTFGTQVYTAAQVRVNHAINSATGSKLGDDYRQFIFKDMAHPKGLGYRYKFNNNTWLCMNSDTYKFVTASTTVRRCNNLLKWKDQYGVIRQEPCVIDYAYSGTQVDFDQAINIPSGNLVVSVQYNQYTSGIKINDRFIFGSQAFKVRSLNDFFQNQTGLNSTTPLLYLDVYKDSIAEGDDLVNGIAVSNINYTISLDTVTINQTVGYASQLKATLKRNGIIVSDLGVMYDDGLLYDTGLQYVDETFRWSSSNTNIATVDASGNFTLLSNGTCQIRVEMFNNPDIFAICNVTVQAVPVLVREVRITPNVTEILQGKTVNYTCELYVNNVFTPSTFTFVGSGTPNANYVLTTIDGNTFSVANKLKSTIPLVVTASNGVDSKTQTIILKGAW